MKPLTYTKNKNPLLLQFTKTINIYTKTPKYYKKLKPLKPTKTETIKYYKKLKPLSATND